MSYSKEEVIDIIKNVSSYEKTLSNIGHILRDKYLILSLKEYGIKLKDYVSMSIDYEVYCMMQSLQKCIKHMQDIKHKRDTHSAVILSEKIAKMKGLIHNKLKNNKIDSHFIWTPETNEKLLGRYGRA